jgi:peptide-methionine (S)-S-oxide reductase
MNSAVVRTGAVTIAVLAGLIGIGALNNVATGRAARVLPHPVLDGGPTGAGRLDTVVFAGGCFWGIQAVFEHVKGVASATAGYSGGSADTASYEEVSTGTTGHAESVQVMFDSSIVSFGQLLEVFLSVAHDPTELNRQGPDIGTQYRSVIFVTGDEQRQVARAYIDQLTRARAFTRPIVTQVVPLRAFYPAEAYHQDYVKHHPDEPYIVVNDLPKVARLRVAFPALYH